MVVIVGKGDPDLDGEQDERRGEQGKGDHEEDRSSPDVLDAQIGTDESENDEHRRRDAAADG